MLHDNFPTNVFSISELTSFGYTRYSLSCPTRQFAKQLNADSWSKTSRSHPSSTHHRSNIDNSPHQESFDNTVDSKPCHQESDPLLAAYISLLTARIPCHWCYIDNKETTTLNLKRRSATLDRELWVFWLNDKSLLEDNGLDKLTECQSGNMTWDSIVQNNGSISTGTPQSPKSGATEPTSSATEYEMFIRALRNVLDRPHGTPGILRLQDMAEFTEDYTQKCLESWADNFGSNQELADEISRSLPRLVAISVSSGRNEIILQCPVERVFVPISCKDSPSDVGQLNGMGSRNLGFIEDLGAKFAIWSWQEKTRNAIASPAVPKLVQPILEHTPVLAEPRNRLKAGSSAWQQQQQQSQSFFLQQQQDALIKRSSNAQMYDTNKIDYWSFTDPYAYLTSIVLNSCANAEPKGADSPSAVDNQVSIVVPITPTTNPAQTRLHFSRHKTKSKEVDGWIRVRPKRNTVIPPSTHNFGALDIPDGNQTAWSNGSESTSMPASEIGSNLNNATQFNANATNDSSQTDSQNASTSNSAYQLPIDLPADNSDMMTGLMDLNSIMGLYAAGTSDDLDEWGVVTKDDFSFFDEQPPSAPAPRAMPLVPEISFDNLQSSIPMSSTDMEIISGISSVSSSVIPTTNGIASAFPDGVMTSSPIDEDSLLGNIDHSLASFGNTTSSISMQPSGGADRFVATSSTIGMPLTGDQPTPSQSGQDVNMQTPKAHPLEKDSSQSDAPLQHQSLILSTSLPISLQDNSNTKRSSILVTHLHSPVQSFIPSSFSPLKIVGDDLVDDTKYKIGGRFAYRRLNKHRRSSIPVSHYPYRRESRMLPFYQPGKDQEWIVPPRKGRQRRNARSLPYVNGIIWNGFKSEGSISINHGDLQPNQSKPRTARPEPPVRAISTPATAWGLSSYPLHSGIKRKKDESSSGESDSDSTSTSSGIDSDDDNSITSTSASHPKFGRLSRNTEGSIGLGNSDQVGTWTLRGVNSAKFVATILDRAMYTSAGSALLSLDSASTVSRQVLGWSSADAFHSKMEFDTPFTPVIFSAAPPALIDEPPAVHESLASEYFLEAVRVLCEQAVLGDYPFAGSNEVTGTSGEITEGESFHVMLARRRILKQQLTEGVATVPALGDESFRNVMEIKTAVFDLLSRLRGNPSEDTVALPVPSEAAQEMGVSISTLHGHHHHPSQSNIPPPVIMKGPLTLLQYFTLGETQQTPSKYGKYQVKKKKTAEPALMQLQSPDIVVGHNDDWLEASPTILRFWEKLSLGPYSNRKNISYFVIYPESSDMENNVLRFWRELSVVFETSLLGRHQPGVLQDCQSGLVPIPLLSALPGESMEMRQVRSYIDGCQKLGSLLGTESKDKDKDSHTVIYMVNPFPHGAGYFDLCRSFSILKTQFRTAMGSTLTPMEQLRDNLVLQLVPIQHVVNPSTFGGYLLFGLKDIAFTVYTKCRVFLERPTFSRDYMAQINSYAPPFILAKTTPQAIHFDVNQKPNSMPKPPATLHVGYGFSLDGRWLICVWTDHRGELLEHLVLDMSNNTSRMLMSGKFSNTNMRYTTKDRDSKSRPLLTGIREIWNRTLVYQKRGSFTWKTVISKLGLMTRLELQEWTRLTAGTNYTAIVAVNIDSAIRMYPHNRGAEYLSTGMTPNTSGVNTPTQSSVLGAGTPLVGANSILSTPLSQSMVPNVAASSTSASTPDMSTTPVTPLAFGNAGNNAGTTGLGIAGAGGSASGAIGGMAGIGGISGNEMLENSAGQVYAMILNHRIPLIVSQQESGLSYENIKRVRGGIDEGLQSRTQTDITETQSTVGPKEEPEEGEYDSKDIQQEDSIMSTPLAGLDQDLDMEPSIKQEEAAGQHVLLKAEKIGEKDLSTEPMPTFTGGNDVIVPLSSGYLIQVPIQSNSVMREKHALEALGIEVHLLHLQRIPTPTPPPIPKPTTTPSPRRPMTGKEYLASYKPSPNSVIRYQMARSNPSYQMNPAASKYVPYRPSNFVLPHYRPPSSSAESPTPSTSSMNSLSQSPGGSVGKNSATDAGGSGSGSGVGGVRSGSGGSALGEKVGLGNSDRLGEKGNDKGGAATTNTTTVKATVATNSTREILKQFHSLSYLSQSPVQTNCLPNHLVLVERLSRVLLLVHE
ncbi:mediator of RNA polymerase II transcription subunit 13 [Linnemannia zychae]|nr:mediator of RNA polymerase II transcription subunit 13 [Linnemannia zychae]